MDNTKKDYEQHYKTIGIKINWDKKQLIVNNTKNIQEAKISIKSKLPAYNCLSNNNLIQNFSIKRG